MRLASCPYGSVGIEIQDLDSGKSVAIVHEVQDRRLKHLDGVRSKAGKLGTLAHQAEAEARELGGKDARARAAAYAQLFVAAPLLLNACRSALGTLHGRSEEVCKVVSAELRAAIAAVGKAAL